MIGSRRTKRFVAAFAIAIVVVALAIVVRGGGSSDSTRADPTTAPSASAPTSSTSARAATTEPATDESTAAPTTTPPTLPPIGTLPVLDMTAECVTLHGEGATPIPSDEGPPDACRAADGEERPFDANSACEARFGAGQLSVRVLTDDGGEWKCRVAERVALDQPDWQGHCEQAYGAEAYAFIYQSNSSGWACASVRNGIYLEYVANLDQACHDTYGPDTFGIALKVEDGGRPEDNICYGAQP